jgi:prevent-host-death family protein
MKHVTASEARKNWFKLLDEASNGESIAINRNGKNPVLRLQREEAKRFRITAKSSRHRTQTMQTVGMEVDDRGLTPVIKAMKCVLPLISNLIVTDAPRLKQF